MTVYIGGVQTFKETKPDKAHALKPLEEAAEVFGAWQAWRESGPTLDNAEAGLVDRVVDECCDVITAACNLLSMLGVTDLREAMERCAERQRDRGRL